MTKTILLILALGILESAEVSEWTTPTVESHYKLSYNATLKTSRWEGYSDPNYTWDGQRLSYERQVTDEDGKKRTVKTFKQPYEIIANFKAESKVLCANSKIERAVAKRFGSLKDFVWLDNVSGGGTVVFPDVGEHIFLVRDRQNPVPKEIHTYEVIDGKTHIYVDSFSGVGMAAGTPAVLVAHWKMNENTASDNAELVTNGNFAAWTTDNPNDWTVVGESGNDPEVSQVGTGEGHGGAGTGCCNIYTSDGTAISVKHALTLVTGRKYRLSITVDTVTDGSIYVADGAAGGPAWTQQFITSTGTHTWTFVAIQTTITIFVSRQPEVGCDVTFDDVSVKLCAVEDSSGNDHDGLLQEDTSAAHVAGIVNGGFDFNGTSDYIEIADHDDFTPSGGFSISAWVYMHDATNFIIATKGVFGVDGEWRFFVAGADKPAFYKYDESTNGMIGRYSDTVVPQNVWVHLVATSDGGILSSGVKIYQNGTRVDDTTNEVAGFVAVENLTHAVWIGNYNNTNYADGPIDIVTIFSTELSQDDVNILCNAVSATEIVAELDQQISPRRANLSPLPLRRRYEF